MKNSKYSLVWRQKNNRINKIKFYLNNFCFHVSLDARNEERVFYAWIILRKYKFLSILCLIAHFLQQIVFQALFQMYITSKSCNFVLKEA